MMIDTMSMLGPFFLKTAVSLFLTGLVGVFMWPFRKAKKEWANMISRLEAVHAELTTQRSNCLNTIQQQGEASNILLEKSVEILENIRLDLATQTGYLAQAVSRPT